MPASLKDVEALIDQLEPGDQVRVLQYLVPRLANAVNAAKPVISAEVDRAWQEFRHIGQQLAAMPGSVSITRAITDTRR